MPASSDRPGADPDVRADQPRAPADGGPPPGSRDELMRRLAQLPASHPSSPWRERPPRAGRERDSRPAESRPAAGPPDPGQAREREMSGLGGAGADRSEENVSSESAGKAGRGSKPAGGRARDASAGEEASRQDKSGLPAAIGRLRHGREAGKDREADDRLWELAARQHAASRARRDARAARPARGESSGGGEPYRPWFADSAEEELWLNADHTGDPWYAVDDQP